MPSLSYDNQKKAVNYYGVFTLWASILLLASYFILYTSGCGDVGSLEIHCILAVAFTTGILLFLVSFCNIAVRLFHQKCVFYLLSYSVYYVNSSASIGLNDSDGQTQIVLILVSHAFLLLYTAYQTLWQKCELTLYYERNYSMLKNVTAQHELIRKTFQSMNSRRNDHYTVSAILDLIAGLLYGASAYAFRHRF